MHYIQPCLDPKLWFNLCLFFQEKIAKATAEIEAAKLSEANFEKARCRLIAFFAIWQHNQRRELQGVLVNILGGIRFRFHGFMDATVGKIPRQQTQPTNWLKA